jgi:hypothetical protein
LSSIRSVASMAGVYSPEPTSANAPLGISASPFSDYPTLFTRAAAKS